MALRARSCLTCSWPCTRQHQAHRDDWHSPLTQDDYKNFNLPAVRSLNDSNCSALAIWSPLEASMTPNLDPLASSPLDEHQQVEDLTNYLREHSRSGFQHHARTLDCEGDEQCSPAHSGVFMKPIRGLSTDLGGGGGRYRPFQERMHPRAQSPHSAVFDHVRTEELTHGLNERMGTAPVEQPTTLRDIVSASMEHHEHE